MPTTSSIVHGEASPFRLISPRNASLLELANPHSSISSSPLTISSNSYISGSNPVTSRSSLR